MPNQKFDLCQLRFTAPSLELKVAGGGIAGEVEGIASSFNGGPDRQGDSVKPGAFRKTLEEHSATGTAPAMLWSHAEEWVIGRWVEMKEVSAGLYVRGHLNLKTTRGVEALEHIQAGDARGLSIGYNIPEGGRKYAGAGAYVLTEIDLIEVSIVATPADRRARVTGLKSFTSKAELADALREMGLAKAAAQRVAAAGWPALAGTHEHDAKAADLAAKIAAATLNLKGLVK